MQVIKYTDEELHAKRAAILEQFRLDDRGFAPILEWRELDWDEYLANNELEGIAFLLGEDR
jgi:3'-phosphoadenosine 5'-phosphosulfate sulfotransferase (PAPS reductase)/FAD synthetase